MGVLQTALQYTRDIKATAVYDTIRAASMSSDSDTDFEKYRPAKQEATRSPHRRTRSHRISRILHYTAFLILSACISGIAAVSFVRAFPGGAKPHADNSLEAITNSTLGFDKIYSISLPRHWHKHDGQLLAARYTGLDITPIEGVMYDDIPRTEYPLYWHDPFPGSIGCWRAHLNVLADIVDSGAGSALILEDDADWDVSLKPQLQEFARGAMVIQGADGAHKSSPYGDEWDLLQLGGCHFDQPPHDHKYYLIENDPTVPPQSVRHSWWAGPEEVPEMNNTRTIFKMGYTTCTTGYAVTQSAARRMLAAISLPPNVVESAIDRKYGRMCAHMEGELPLRCIGVYPPLIGMHRFAGSSNADSDIDNGWEAEIHPEYAFDLVYSATMNVLPFALGSETAVAQKWDGEEARADIPRIGMKFEWSSRLVEIEPRE